ncbi:redoxin domain-containing protein [Pararhizobium mangrovi]|uniref:Redoxin domain-containing protein n=1 Tax=Pararhizobium mangrovi TaxID=2590452 RepID=A0A506U3U0_9HYPH|nr:redoxin domain-containing protein [Pararhizobium mangrovi]TPW27694.1 redoxin domain-containing protein [Pararhizobium mangrovi]
MSFPTKFEAGGPFPSLSWQPTEGERVTPANEAGWRLLIIYRGKHCPICRKFLGRVDSMRDKFKALGVTLWALSADPVERAREEAEQEGWTIPILTGLAEDEMRTLGLYISSPRSANETDRNFAEPAMFLIGPAGTVQAVDVASAPYLRPDLDTVLAGISFVQDKDSPARGIVD